MDLTRLRTGEQIAAVAAIALFIIMFAADWFGIKAGGVEFTRDAWGSYGFTDVILLLTVLAAIGLAYLSASGARVNLPVAASAIVTALGILSLILIIISIISPPNFAGVSLPEGVDKTRHVGVWLGLIATAVLTYGGYLAMQEEGTTFGAQADRLRGGGGSGRRGPGAPPPPPPPSSGTGTGPPPPSA
jgi:hypothetical protein